MMDVAHLWLSGKIPWGLGKGKHGRDERLRVRVRKERTQSGKVVERKPTPY
jgi:hypothetical protein